MFFMAHPVETHHKHMHAAAHVKTYIKKKKI